MAADGLHVPKLSDSAEDKADWVELYALKDNDGNASFSDLVSALSHSGTADAVKEEENDELPEPLIDDDRYEAAAEDAFLEITERKNSCGLVANSYPFDLRKNAVLRHNKTVSSVYTFLLLLSRYDHMKGGTNGANLFEELCAKVVESYLGPDETYVDSYVFGFPRRIGPKQFCEAIDELCHKLGEGIGHKKRPDSASQKDAKLDIVAWRHFADRRGGKLIAFGQCATGDNWSEKTAELIQTWDWWTQWIGDRPGAWPVRMFLVPHRVEECKWLHTCTRSGILFDRCRITQHSYLVSEDLRKRLASWSGAVLNECLK